MNLKANGKVEDKVVRKDITIPWITIRKNPLDEYWDLESRKESTLPNHWGYVFTPEYAYEVRPENIYVQGTAHRYVVKDELIRHEYKDMKNMTFQDNELGTINISKLLVEYVNTQFRFWSSAQYHTGKKWNPTLKSKCTKLV